MQIAIEEGTVEFSGKQYNLDNFCFKPISGKGCLVTSPMQYWKSDVKKMLEDPDVKITSQCIPPPDGSTRACFDKIGVPVMQNAIFGKLDCKKESDSPCSACSVYASGFQTAFLLNNNYYQFDLA